MIYAIIIIVSAVAIFLIFRNDHDGSYNTSENGSRMEHKAQSRPQQHFRYQKFTESAHKADAGPKTAPKTEPKSEKKASAQSFKEQLLGEIEAAINTAKKNAEEPMKVFGEAMGRAKEAFMTAVNEAQKGWNAASPRPDVDEQFQDYEDPDFDDEELDLSFLDNIDFSEDLEENTETFDITGLKYRCTVHDCGRIVGVVQPEPSNAHDSRAQAVIRNDGKLLGYIPHTQLDWYEDFNEQNIPCPFVGEIETDDRGGLIAEIKVIIPSSREFVKEEIEDGI